MIFLKTFDFVQNRVPSLRRDLKQNQISCNLLFYPALLKIVLGQYSIFKLLSISLLRFYLLRLLWLREAAPQFINFHNCKVIRRKEIYSHFFEVIRLVDQLAKNMPTVGLTLAFQSQLHFSNEQKTHLDLQDVFLVHPNFKLLFRLYKLWLYVLAY